MIIIIIIIIKIPDPKRKKLVRNMLKRNGIGARASFQVTQSRNGARPPPSPSPSPSPPQSPTPPGQGLFCFGEIFLIFFIGVKKKKKKTRVCGVVWRDCWEHLKHPLSF